MSAPVGVQRLSNDGSHVCLGYLHGLFWLMGDFHVHSATWRCSEVSSMRIVKVMANAVISNQHQRASARFALATSIPLLTPKYAPLSKSLQPAPCAIHAHVVGSPSHLQVKIQPRPNIQENNPCLRVVIIARAVHHEFPPGAVHMGRFSTPADQVQEAIQRHLGRF